MEKTRYTPIIFITALSREEKNIFKGYESGAVDYLLKPIVPNILRSKVKIFLEMDIQKRKILALTEALKKENIELIEKNGIMAMAVTVTHEISQPLSVLMGSLELINIRYKEQLSDYLKAYLDKISDATFEIKKLLDTYRNAENYKLSNYTEKTKMVEFVDEEITKK